MKVLVVRAVLCIILCFGSVFTESGSGSSLLLNTFPIRIQTKFVKGTFRLLKHEISSFFPLLGADFDLPGPESNPGPDPKHWCYGSIVRCSS
jgi:hypothetical protein